MDQDVMKTVGGLLARHALGSLAAVLVTLGVLHSGDSAQFVDIASGIVVGLLTLAWSWWQKEGQAKVAAALRKVTAKPTTAAAVAVAAKVPVGSAVTPGLPPQPVM